MKRFEDEGAYKYSFYAVLRRCEQVDVKCKCCGGHAYILNQDGHLAWKCSQCFAHGVHETEYHYKAKSNCVQCERWFNVEVRDEKKTSHKSSHIECPHCGSVNHVVLHKNPVYRGYYPDIRDGRDPIFKMELYFLDYIKGKMVWAVNRAHLNYLISYISADLRVKPGNVPVKTASHTIPAYIKNAKNRELVVRTLTKLQHTTG
ncbi:hypothetical protein ACFTRD_16885 [Paenibacillus sp. NPDC056933]|uniref:hypothetical protein n=1 Tax=Paenibacillus sp. NPDC056933 TaxID=3345968 RepID=UPI003635D9D2